MQSSPWQHNNRINCPSLQTYCSALLQLIYLSTCFHRTTRLPGCSEDEPWQWSTADGHTKTQGHHTRHCCWAWGPVTHHWCSCSGSLWGMFVCVLCETRRQAARYLNIFVNVLQCWRATVEYDGRLWTCGRSAPMWTKVELRLVNK